MGTLQSQSDTIKLLVADPWTVVRVLGFDEKARTQPGGVIHRCPAHGDNEPSCSTRQVGGIVLSHCFACGFRGDIYDFVAAVYRLDRRGDFCAVKQKTIALFGLHGATERPPPRPPHAAQKPRGYPPDAAAFWARCGSVEGDPTLSTALAGRCIDPAAVADLDLARVLPSGTLPDWGQSWRATGHAMVLQRYNARGQFVSVHGRSLTERLDRDGKAYNKGRNPKGYDCAGLVMADRMGCSLLVMGTAPPRWTGEVYIAEGGTDFLTLATRWGDAAESLPATFGIVEGAWTAQHAARIPAGAFVRVFTDPDAAGQQYAEQITRTLDHCRVERWKPKQRAQHA